MTRSREAELGCLFLKKKKITTVGNVTSSASVAMCETFFAAMRSILTDRLIPRGGLMKAGTCERSEVCAGITKAVRIF
jgi:hypothetical protein